MTDDVDAAQAASILDDTGKTLRCDDTLKDFRVELLTDLRVICVALSH
jgi:hypothetical protein